MSDQPGEEVPLEPEDPWGSVRRVKEPLAWILLMVTAIAVFVSALQLFGLVGVPVPVPSGPGQADVTSVDRVDQAERVPFGIRVDAPVLAVAR